MNFESRLEELLVGDSIGPELVELLKQQYAQEFADQHEAWLAEQERQARKYIWVTAGDLTYRDVICEPQFKGRKVMKYSVSEVLPARSRFDRQVVVIVDKIKRWRYDQGDPVLVLA